MSSAAASDGIAIRLTDIVKRFPGVVANDGVNLEVRQGTIHAIVGENGSGKSTLMKTLYGAHRPDEGRIEVNGVERHFKSPRDAIDVGIGMVFQHFQLAENFTVWENVVLGDEPGTRWNLNRRLAIRRVQDLAERYGLLVDPEDLVADLGVGEKQRVEILKVLYRGAKIIILDEPTAVLVPQEVDELFDSLRELTHSGATVLFISHKLDEVLSVAGAVTVIRAGRTVADVLPAEVTARGLAELMVGHDLPTPATQEQSIRPEIVLSVHDLSLTSGSGAESRRVINAVDFSIHAGQIVGIAGVEGNGQSELIDLLLGLRSPTRGSIVLDGADITLMDTRHRRQAGIGYVPEDRQHDGLVLSFSLWENVVLGHQRAAQFSKGPFVDRPGAKAHTDEIIERYDVRAPGHNVSALALSGGNQQKLVVGRELSAEPRVLIAAHPTRGVDVGAQAIIWDLMRQARSAGKAMLLISADLDELIGLSDTLLVLLRGKIVANLDPAVVTPRDLGSYMTGAQQEDVA